MNRSSGLLVEIKVKQLDSGHLYATSPQVPGLHVARDTEDGLKESLIAGIKALFLANRKMDVEVVFLEDQPDEFPRVPQHVEKAVVLACH